MLRDGTCSESPFEKEINTWNANTKFLGQHLYETLSIRQQKKVSKIYKLWELEKLEGENAPGWMKIVDVELAQGETSMVLETEEGTWLCYTYLAKLPYEIGVVIVDSEPVEGIKLPQYQVAGFVKPTLDWFLFWQSTDGSVIHPSLPYLFPQEYSENDKPWFNFFVLACDEGHSKMKFTAKFKSLEYAEPLYRIEIPNLHSYSEEEINKDLVDNAGWNYKLHSRDPYIETGNILHNEEIYIRYDYDGTVGSEISQQLKADPKAFLVSKINGCNKLKIRIEAKSVAIVRINFSYRGKLRVDSTYEISGYDHAGNTYNLESEAYFCASVWISCVGNSEGVAIFELLDRRASIGDISMDVMHLHTNS